mmetsp:Transcript_1619/g.5371  ORF Transcript_1619/g.5371 Transcript_1619/m.5371 type:complete len:173 (-) Transcript_1619:228-746(-)
MTSLAVNESRPDVGSSRNSTRGFVMSAIPMFTRFACPPEMPLLSSLPINTSLQDSNPSTLISSLTAIIFRAASSDILRFKSAVYRSISSTVRIGNSVSTCSTYPVKRLKNCLDALTPPYMMSPLVLPTVFLPAKRSRRVVFPEPEGPISAVISPSLRYPVTFFNKSICSLLF